MFKTEGVWISIGFNGKLSYDEQGEFSQGP